jgi:multicomponent Na+:H+ antiporter subunit A
VLGAVAPALGRRMGRNVLLLCGLGPLATVVWALTRAGAVLDGEPVVERYGWVPELGLDLELRLDGFGLLMLSLVSGIGVLIFAYARWYFHDRPGLGRFAGTLVAFSGAMLGLVLADNLLVVYLFWELTSVTSYLLIGFEDEKAPARAAALQAILITGAGGLAMLGGFVLIGLEAGTFSLSGILAQPPSGTAVDVGLVLVLVGAVTKSAQVPFHSWLPGAMAAPTPVSAYLHSATMVKAGVYLIARFAPAFAEAAPWRPIVLTLGLTTMLVGGLRALRQHDLKLLLAYGTVSQLGFMVVLLGAGLEEATLAGCAVLVAHGAFKAALFMTVGIVDHQAHTRDIRRLDRLWSSPRWRPTLVAAVVGAASMAGIPLMLGFVAKEAAYEAFVHGGLGGPDGVVLAGLVVGSILTFAYSARFVRGLLGPASTPEAVSDPPAPAAPFLGPVVVLAALTVILGIAPEPASDLVSQAGVALDAAVEPVTLHLWHGLNQALLLSLLTIATGTALALGWRGVERVQDRTPDLPTADGGYRAILAGTLGLAARTTGFVQNGSLPAYLTVILATVVALPGWVLLTATEVPPLPELADSPIQVVVGTATLGAAIAAAIVRRRFDAVLLLGGVGFAVAVLFVIQGAPDLALTQLMIETLSVLIFVLVLRRLPTRVDDEPWRFGIALRVLVSGVVGAFVFAFAIIATGARTAPPISDGYLERALPEADGRNVVNVILVDFRGLDTLGEITVLAVAALGIVSLVLAARRAVTSGEPDDDGGAPPTGAPSTTPPAPAPGEPGRHIAAAGGGGGEGAR